MCGLTAHALFVDKAAALRSLCDADAGAAAGAADRAKIYVLVGYDTWIRITDPKTFTKPWKISMPLYRRKDANMQLMQYKCVEFVEELMYGKWRRNPLD